MSFSLDGIFTGLPLRHVEQANARLEIRRDESQGGRRKKDQSGGDDYVSVPWEDISYVTVASLRVFLGGLLAAGDDSVYQPVPHEASSTINQRAVSAYQSIGRAGHDENITSAPPPISAVETNFTDEDLDRVRGFVVDLAALDHNGVTELALQRSATFLDSIDAAIAHAKPA